MRQVPHRHKITKDEPVTLKFVLWVICTRKGVAYCHLQEKKKS